MIMSDIVTPVVPKQFQGITLRRVARKIAQRQSTTIAFQQRRHTLRSFRFMKARAIGHNNHASFAMGRARHARFNHLAKSFRIAFLVPNPNDITRSPISGGHFVSFGGPDPWCLDLFLLATLHPGSGQCGKETHFNFVLNIVLQRKVRHGIFLQQLASWKEREDHAHRDCSRNVPRA